MILISHRGNTNGPNPELENTLEYINSAIGAGYECEIDLWVNDGTLFLGHDAPIHSIDLEQIRKLAGHLYIHAKNADAVEYLIKHDWYGYNFFMHDKDPYVLTSRGEAWCYPSKMAIPYGINLMPEWNNLTKQDLKDCYGVCSDYIGRYK